VWYASCWFVAQWQKENDLVGFYRDGALGELERMTKEYQLSDDITEDIPRGSSYDDPTIGGFPNFDFQD